MVYPLLNTCRLSVVLDVSLQFAELLPAHVPVADPSLNFGVFSSETQLGNDVNVIAVPIDLFGILEVLEFVFGPSPVGAPEGDYDVPMVVVGLLEFRHHRRL